MHMDEYEELSEDEQYRKNLKLAKQVLAISIFALAFFFTSLFTGCRDDDGCENSELQCDGTVLEICNADHGWEDVVDCADYGEECDDSGEEATCQ